MDNRGFFLTRHAIGSQIAAMPCELYLLRLIHHQTRRAFPGERLWTEAQLVDASSIRFLRIRNCEGFDVYIQPHAGNQNAGYVLVDLDRAGPMVVEAMRANGHDPCVVLQTSPGRLQAWIRLSTSPLEPAVATAASKHLAHLYGGDPASTDWRHLGRLAGFTNQKPARRTSGGYAPWVKIVHSRAGLAPHAEPLLHCIRRYAPPPANPVSPFRVHSVPSEPDPINAADATAIYRTCMQRWHILERFPEPDWSIVDLWVARHLLSLGTPEARIQAILRLASPLFPRRHGDPDDYLRRTLARAAFPSPPPTVCARHDRASSPPETNSACSNSTGGR
ncbi:MAG: DNA-primase RepB domain-containing protein [Gammaproteobacteria bacterium]